MNKIPCQYVIVRFAPYVETGEFANVGIILLAPKRGYFDFQLEIQDYARITRFFAELDRKVYPVTLNILQDELIRVGEMLKHGDLNDSKFSQDLFNEIIRPREAIVRFSEVRAVLTNDPVVTLKELFGFYVKQNFVNEEYREVQ